MGLFFSFFSSFSFSYFIIVARDHIWKNSRELKKIIVYPAKKGMLFCCQVAIMEAEWISPAVKVGLGCVAVFLVLNLLQIFLRQNENFPFNMTVGTAHWQEWKGFFIFSHLSHQLSKLGKHLLTFVSCLTVVEWPWHFLVLHLFLFLCIGIVLWIVLLCFSFQRTIAVKNCHISECHVFTVPFSSQFSEGHSLSCIQEGPWTQGSPSRTIPPPAFISLPWNTWWKPELWHWDSLTNIWPIFWLGNVIAP